jgi:hypothetical protein
MTRTRLASLALGLLLATALVSPGCGNKAGNQGEVNGRVTLDSQPIEQGSILFTPIDGTRGTVTGGSITHGRYELAGRAGPALGWNRVEIHAMRNAGQMVQKPFAPLGEMVESQEDAIPPSYNSASTLKIEITPGMNAADFEIVSK